ncbi:MAG: acetamidase/formamidase family protein [Endomicrobium sp.]|nr:acetamidase/formamidase family protein [Endomicrobium sp.]
MKNLTRSKDNVHFLIDAQNKPRLTVKPGELFSLETIRADNMYLSRENPNFKDHAHVMEIQANPVTGPVYIETARAGDVIEVTIEDITLADSGNEAYCSYIPGQGVFMNPYAPEPFKTQTRWIDASGNILKIPLGKKEFLTPKEPFIGTIAVAAAQERILSFYANKNIVGNVDCPQIKKGSVVSMPVNVDGALLSVGDLHAKQGDGELLGCAVEADGKVTLSVKTLKRGAKKYFNLPQVDSKEFIGSVCSVDNNIEAAIRGAAFDIIKRIETCCAIPYIDAYILAGQCLKIQICQMIGNACTAFAYIERKLLESLRG